MDFKTPCIATSSQIWPTRMWPSFTTSPQPVFFLPLSAKAMSVSPILTPSPSTGFCSLPSFPPLVARVNEFSLWETTNCQRYHLHRYHHVWASIRLAARVCDTATTSVTEGVHVCARMCVCDWHRGVLAGSRQWEYTLSLNWYITSTPAINRMMKLNGIQVLLSKLLCAWNFVHRLVSDLHEEASVDLAFMLPCDSKSCWVNCLIRAKSHFSHFLIRFCGCNWIILDYF